LDASAAFAACAPGRLASVNILATKRVWSRMRSHRLARAFEVFAVFCLLAVVATAQSADPAPRIIRLDGSTITAQQMDAAVDRLLEAAHVTGAGVAIFHDGGIAYLKAYGLRNTQKNLPLTPNSVMTSASLSKAAFATVVMRLVQQGKLKLDNPVYEYLPQPLPAYPRIRRSERR
jgi:CubicO group peptidase (beta-lactamase class C family)